MPRRNTEISDEFPYHLTARALNGDWFKLPTEMVWRIKEDYLYLTAHLYNVKIHSFVLMSNHYHLLATFPNGNVSEAMNYLMRETSREITRLSGRINQTYGGRHKKSLIKSHHYFMNAYKYVYQNPMRAGICRRVEAYPFSTLAGLCGMRHMNIPLQEDTLLFSPNFDQETLNWLNRPAGTDQVDSMKKALKRPIFELPRQRLSKKPNILEQDLI